MYDGGMQVGLSLFLNPDYKQTLKHGRSLAPLDRFHKLSWLEMVGSYGIGCNNVIARSLGADVKWNSKKQFSSKAQARILEVE